MRARKQYGAGPSARGVASVSNLLGVRGLVATSLYDAEGNHVGTLEEIVLDVRTGCVRHVVVAVGGFLGFRRRRLAVPWSALTLDADYGRGVIDIAQMHLTAVRIPDGDPWLRRPAPHRVSARPLFAPDRRHAVRSDASPQTRVERETTRACTRAVTRLAVQTEHGLARGAAKSPLLPHEHDESPEESTRADPLAVQAHADLQRGLVDTERRQDATSIFNTRQRKSKHTSR